MIYFNTTAPLLLTSEQGFDGYAVNVNEPTARTIIQISELLDVMKERIYSAGAPEDYAQELAERFVNDVTAIIQGEPDATTSYNF